MRFLKPILSLLMLSPVLCFADVVYTDMHGYNANRNEPPIELRGHWDGVFLNSWRTHRWRLFCRKSKPRLLQRGGYRGVDSPAH